MTMYHVLLIVSVIIVILVVVMIVVTIKNTIRKKEEEKAYHEEKKKYENNWNHIKDFKDINEVPISGMNRVTDGYGDDVMTVGVYTAGSKKQIFENEEKINNMSGSYSSFGGDDEFQTMSLAGAMKREHIQGGDETMVMPRNMGGGIVVTLRYNDNGGEKEVKMISGEINVGREIGNDIIPADNSYMSRFHATFSIRGDKLFLRDRDSKNGTYIDTRKVSGEVEITNNCAVKFGSTLVYVTISKG